jgi:hypothetical protein
MSSSCRASSLLVSFQTEVSFVFHVPVLQCDFYIIILHHDLLLLPKVFPLYVDCLDHFPIFQFDIFFIM